MQFTSDPDAPLCRHCGGDGISFRTHPRLVQALRTPVHIGEYTSAVSGRHIERTLNGVGVNNPLRDYVLRLHHHVGLGADEIHEALIDLSFACGMCLGTGRRRRAKDAL